MACDNPNHPHDCTGVGFVMPDGSRLAEHMIECRPRDPGIIAAEAFKARRRLGIGHPDASPAGINANDIAALAEFGMALGAPDSAGIGFRTVERRTIHPDGRPAVSVEFSGPMPEGLIQRADQDWRPHGPDARVALPIGREERDRLAAEQIEACARAAYAEHWSRMSARTATPLDRGFCEKMWSDRDFPEVTREDYRALVRAVLKAAGR